MSKKAALIKKGKYTPVVFSGSPLEKLQNDNRMNKHSRFQRDTHFEFEQENDSADTNFDELPFDIVQTLNEG